MKVDFHTLKDILEASFQDLESAVCIFQNEFCPGGSSELELFWMIRDGRNSRSCEDLCTLAGCLSDRAEEFIYSVSYKDVIPFFRVMYLLSAFARSLVNLHKALLEEASITDEQDTFIKILDIMYQAELVSGLEEGEISKLTLRYTESLSKVILDTYFEKEVFRLSLGTLANVSIDRPITESSSSPTIVVFMEFMNRDIPLVIRNGASGWPALGSRRWSNLSYLVDAVGPLRLVPVEICGKYTDDTWRQVLMRFRDFVKNHLLNAQESPGTAYLAQHNLLKQSNGLMNDIVVPDYCFLEYENPKGNDNVIINTWLGPKGTVSPLHQDSYHNIFVQVIGCKYVRLYPDKERDKLYPYSQEVMLSNTSMVDIENLDTRKFPLFSEANYTECLLKPGDMLYIPRNCWHFVKSLSVSLSVSFWW